MATLGLVLLVVGLLMLTVAAPPQRVGGAADANPVLVTAPGALALTGRTVEVEVDGEAFVGLGRADEVEAWLDGVAATQVDGVTTETTLLTRVRPGDAPGSAVPPADPALADLWQDERSGADPALRVQAPTDEQVLVVAAPAGAEATAHVGPSGPAPGGVAARWRPGRSCWSWGCCGSSR